MYIYNLPSPFYYYLPPNGVFSSCLCAVTSNLCSPVFPSTRPIIFMSLSTLYSSSLAVCLSASFTRLLFSILHFSLASLHFSLAFLHFSLASLNFNLSSFDLMESETLMNSFTSPERFYLVEIDGLLKMLSRL